VTGVATATDRTSLRRRSFAARVLRSTFVRLGARVGALWIGVLMVAAAFL